MSTDWTDAVEEAVDWRSALEGYYPGCTIEEINEEEYACAHALMFHWTLIRGKKHEAWTGYDDRWCYENEVTATAALIEWKGRDFEGEPVGWHRHPKSGRRRPNGVAAEEYINF